MADMRRRFHEDLELMERTLLEMGEVVTSAVDAASRSLLTDDDGIADSVIAMAASLDEEAIEFERHWLQTMALQTPVAVDLRRMSVFLNNNHSLQRIGHQAMNIAKIARVTTGIPHHRPIERTLQEMSERVLPMLRLSLEAFASKDTGIAAKLEVMDEPVDKLNADIYKLVVECAHDTEMLKWATQMMVVARAYERVGDRAVTIAQQVQFLVSGAYDED